jgi:hypothetical protein
MEIAVPVQVQPPQARLPTEAETLQERQHKEKEPQ